MNSQNDVLSVYSFQNTFDELSIILGLTLLYMQVMHLDAEKEMMSQCVALLGKFIAVREPNIRYLGLVSCLLHMNVAPCFYTFNIILVHLFNKIVLLES